MSFELEEELEELVADLVQAGGGVWTGVVHPGGGGGFEDQDAVVLFPLGEREREPREVTGDDMIGIPPRFVIRERLGMIAFAGAAERDIGEVFVKGVDAQDGEPVPNPFHVLEPQVPAAGTVDFAEGAFPAQLIGEAGDFADGADVAELGVGIFLIAVHEGIDAGPLLPGGERHVVGDDEAFGPFVLPIMAGELEAILFAALVVRFGPAVDEQLEEHLEIIVTDAPPVAHFLGEAGQVIEQTVTPTAHEDLGQIVGPGQAAGGLDVGFVREYPGYATAEMLADFTPISFESDLEELLGHARVKEIDVGPVAVPGRIGGADDRGGEVLAIRQGGPIADVASDLHGAVLIQTKDLERGIRPCRRSGSDAQFESTSAGGGHVFGHPTTGESRGIRILIVDPEVHVEFGGFVERDFPEPKPFAGQIGGHEARAGMDEGLSDVLSGEVAESLADLIFGEIVIPNPERGGGVSARRIDELPFDLARVRRGGGAEGGAKDLPQHSEQRDDQ